MADLNDKNSEAKPLTENEATEHLKKVNELLDRWCEQLSPDEAVAWMDAHIEDLENDLAKLGQEKADFEAITHIMKGHKSLGEAINFIRKKEHRTLAEAEALDAFERIKDIPLRTK